MSNEQKAEFWMFGMNLKMYNTVDDVVNAINEYMKEYPNDMEKDNWIITRWIPSPSGCYVRAQVCHGIEDAIQKSKKPVPKNPFQKINK